MLLSECTVHPWCCSFDPTLFKCQGLLDSRNALFGCPAPTGISDVFSRSKAIAIFSARMERITCVLGNQSSIAGMSLHTSYSKPLTYKHTRILHKRRLDTWPVVYGSNMETFDRIQKSSGTYADSQSQTFLYAPLYALLLATCILDVKSLR
jgi:hypothetical protein